MNRPKLDLYLSSFDKVLNWITLLVVLASGALVLINFNSLPQEVPCHFDGHGQVDRMCQKNILWIALSIGIGLYILVSWLMKFPHRFNYPMKVTEANAAQLYQASVKGMRFIRFLIAIVFLYLVFETISIAKGKYFNLGEWFLPIVMIAFFATLVFMLIRMSQKQS